MAYWQNTDETASYQVPRANENHRVSLIDRDQRPRLYRSVSLERKDVVTSWEPEELSPLGGSRSIERECL